MNDILNKRNELIKKRNIANLIFIPCWILSLFISIDSLVRVLPIIDFITIILKMDYLNRTLLISSLEFIYRYLSTIIYIGGRIYIFKLNKEIISLELNNNIDLLKEKEKMENKKEECIIIDELEVRKTYNILERFANLPRSKQMEILNYIKGDLNIQNKELCNDIDELNNQYKDILQTKCEDILFPDIEEDKKYTKKKEK